MPAPRSAPYPPPDPSPRQQISSLWKSSRSQGPNQNRVLPVPTTTPHATPTLLVPHNSPLVRLMTPTKDEDHALERIITWLLNYLRDNAMQTTQRHRVTYVLCPAQLYNINNTTNNGSGPSIYQHGQRRSVHRG